MSKPQNEVPVNKPDDGRYSKGSGLIVNIITTTLICSIFLGLCYKVMSDMSKQLQKNIAGAEEEVEGEIEEVTKGYILDLGEFTMNLADASHKSYLKTAVVLEVSMTENDSSPTAEGGGHGEKAAPAGIEVEMERYKPAIRDIVITVLSAKTTDELGTTTGKELAKEQITEQVNAVFGGEREVLRISFGQFIMQQGR